MNKRAAHRRQVLRPRLPAAASRAARDDGRGRKRKCVALLESEDVFFGFGAAGADLQQVEFEHGNRVGNKLGERAVHVRGERGVHGVMKDVRHLRGDFGKLREAVAGGSAGESVRGDVKFFEVLGPGLRLLQHAGIFPQILEVFGSLLEEELDGFLIGPVHRLSSTSTDATRDSAATGLR